MKNVNELLLLSGGLQIMSGAASGKVLTSDGGGNGTWQPLLIVDANVSATAAIQEAKLALATDAAPGTGSRRTLGTGAQQAAAGNDGRFPPVGTIVPYTGSGDPAGGGTWVIADGRLIDSTVYVAFDQTCGQAAGGAWQHAYNQNVNPGTNGQGHQQVKIPDKRGRHSIGALNQGTSSISGSNARASNLMGAIGGEVNHALVTAELASHLHTIGGSGSYVIPYVGGTFASAPHTSSTSGSYALPGATPPWNSQAGSDSVGSGTAHNNLGPYETDSYIVRIA
jgi:microcystin-dependent protein